MALQFSGHSVSLPPMANDIADALYWLQDTFSLAGVAAYWQQYHIKTL
jgi:hypothetical protein